MKQLSAITVAIFCCGGVALGEPASYPTPQDAFDALVQAVEMRDHAAFEKVMGSEGVDLVLSDNDAENAKNRAAFIEMVQEGYRFRPEETGVTLMLGEDSWPFPIPLTRSDGGWSFDIEAGREEIDDREIGLNELTIIDLMSAYVDLQAEFRLVDHDKDGVMEFAQSIISDPGARNGLFWPEGGGPVGALLARAAASGWSDGAQDYEPEPFMGYYFEILRSQGENAAGGAYSYIAGENMVAGHALLAVPADYGETGIHSFIVNENGILYQADLGNDSLTSAAEIESYDPGPDWTPVD